MKEGTNKAGWISTIRTKGQLGRDRANQQPRDEYKYGQQFPLRNWQHGGMKYIHYFEKLRTISKHVCISCIKAISFYSSVTLATLQASSLLLPLLFTLPSLSLASFFTCSIICFQHYQFGFPLKIFCRFAFFAISLQLQLPIGSFPPVVKHGRRNFRTLPPFI